ncbi:MAG: prepilin-type N-terminal cleavage/methylation domain-containing protein [Clostridiaceae bacterium]|jgi:prepilin-type N-terminal cleavage/methylation domain-containing protein|nr:prepilin-type N-terminal cleavage/methylation domain-containing protein [Clostridiaceae bacterium]
MRCKKGFTLVEMAVVIAIILILSGIISLAIVQAINRANQTSEKAESHYSDNYDEAKSQVDDLR